MDMVFTTMSVGQFSSFRPCRSILLTAEFLSYCRNVLATYQHRVVLYERRRRGLQLIRRLAQPNAQCNTKIYKYILGLRKTQATAVSPIFFLFGIRTDSLPQEKKPLGLEHPLADPTIWLNPDSLHPPQLCPFVVPR